MEADTISIVITLVNLLAFLIAVLLGNRKLNEIEKDRKQEMALLRQKVAETPTKIDDLGLAIYDKLGELNDTFPGLLQSFLGGDEDTDDGSEDSVDTEPIEV